MSRGFKSKFVLLIALLLVLTSCQKKEISILEDLNQKMKESKGDVEKAKSVLKQFLLQNKVKMQEIVSDFSQLKSQEDRQSRYMKFNNHYYDNLFQTVSDYEYLKDKQFDMLFEIFKKRMGIFFEEERKLH